MATTPEAFRLADGNFRSDSRVVAVAGSLHRLSSRVVALAGSLRCLSSRMVALVRRLLWIATKLVVRSGNLLPFANGQVMSPVRFPSNISRIAAKTRSLLHTAPRLASDCRTFLPG